MLPRCPKTSSSCPLSTSSLPLMCARQNLLTQIFSLLTLTTATTTSTIIRDDNLSFFTWDKSDEVTNEQLLVWVRLVEWWKGVNQV